VLVRDDMVWWAERLATGWVPFLRQGPSFLWVNRREDMSVVGEETGRSLVWRDLAL